MFAVIIEVSLTLRLLTFLADFDLIETYLKVGEGCPVGVLLSFDRLLFCESLIYESFYRSAFLPCI